LLGLILKLFWLDIRPLHHDESLHAQYGKYFANSFTRGFYKYDPLLHGPLLYHLQGLWTWLAGPLSKFGVRIPAVFFGFLISLSPILFRKYLKPISTSFLVLFFTLSTTFNYWSRFLRHDFLTIIAMILALHLWLKKPNYYSFYLGLCAGIHLCAKENFFVHLAILSGFLVTTCVVSRSVRLPSLKSLGFFILGFFIISTPLYSGWFQYSQGLLDGLYRKSLFYWFSQHQTERISGPFYFNGLILSQYETWLIPMALLSLYSWLKLQTLRFRIIDLSVVSFFILIAFVIDPAKYPFMLIWLKIKTPLDIPLFFLSIYFAVRATFSFLFKKQLTYAFV